MKLHTTYGVEALQSADNRGDEVSFIRTAAEIIGTHHEKFDGSGYPNGLKGKEIPLSGRLMAIIDVYDALVSERIYKPAFKHQVALAIIDRERGNHFDPDLVDGFLEIESQIKEIHDRYEQHPS